MKHEPRDYQVACVRGVQEAFASGRRAPLLVAPTGSGKTMILSMVAQAIMSRDAALHRETYIFIIVPKHEIFKQTSLALLDADLPHAFIKAGQPMDMTQRVQLCSASTLINRLDQLAPALAGKRIFKFFDEAQHTASPTYRTIMDTLGGWSLGATATPERLDGRPLTMFDDMILGPTPYELMDKGVLVKPRYVQPACEGIDLSEVRTIGGDWEKKALESLMDKPRIVGEAVAHYFRFCKGRPTLCFDASVGAANVSCGAFQAAGLRWAVLDGKKSQKERDGIIADLHAHQLDGISSCDLVIEGVDVPCLEAAIWRRPTQSLNIWMQGNGRVVRSYEGKTECVIVDCVGNMMHGRVEDARQWSLAGHCATGNGRKPMDSADRLPMRCPNPECACIPPSMGMAVCPYCGTPFPYKGRTLKQTDGTLVEVPNAWGETLSGRALVPCVRCGKPHAEGMDKCPHCGYDYRAAREREETRERYQRKQEVWQCKTVDDLRTYGVEKRGMKLCAAAYWARCIIEARKKKKEMHHAN